MNRGRPDGDALYARAAPAIDFSAESSDPKRDGEDRPGHLGRRSSSWVGGCVQLTSVNL